MIKAVRVYETKGRQFPSLKKAIDHRENLVDKFISSLPGFYELPLKRRIAFIQSILDNRRQLIELLDYDDVPENDD